MSKFKDAGLEVVEVDRPAPRALTPFALTGGFDPTAVEAAAEERGLEAVFSFRNGAASVTIRSRKSPKFHWAYHTNQKLDQAALERLFIGELDKFAAEDK